MQHQFTTPEPSVLLTPILAPEPGTEITAVTSDTLSEQDLASQQTQTEAVNALLAATQRKIRRRKAIYWTSFVLMESVILLDRIIYHFSAWLGLARHIPHVAAGTLWGPLIVLAGLMGLFYTMLQPLDINADELARVGGVRAVPALLDALTSGRTPSQRRVIYPALALLLPQMQASDARLLTVSYRRILNKLLRWGYQFNFDKRNEPEFTLAVLKAYEQVGDAKAIPIVEKLANKKARTARQRAVQQAAAQCLPLLQSHTVPLDQNQTLLRAASQSSAAPDILLRPAQDAAPVPAGELLRAADDLRAEVRTDA